MKLENPKFYKVLEILLTAYRGGGEDDKHRFMCCMIDDCRKTLPLAFRRELQKLIKEKINGKYTLNDYLKRVDSNYSDIINSYDEAWRSAEALEVRVKWYENLIQELKEKNL